MSDNLASRLDALSRDVCRKLAAEVPANPSLVPDFVEYHGFQKSTLRSTDILGLAAQHGFGAEEIQIELVRLNRSLSREAHFHQATHAHVVVLGGQRIFRKPESAWIYLGSQWSYATEGMSIDIPPGVVHGFSVEPDGGVLDFLSVQSPPLVQGDHDDFILMEVPEPFRN